MTGGLPKKYVQCPIPKSQIKCNPVFTKITKPLTACLLCSDLVPQYPDCEKQFGAVLIPGAPCSGRLIGYA